MPQFTSIEQQDWVEYSFLGPKEPIGNIKAILVKTEKPADDWKEATLLDCH